MTELFQLHPNDAIPSNIPELKVDFDQFPGFNACLFQPTGEANIELVASSLGTCVRLDLEDLQGFEVVDCQFERWGVLFSNAIALQPSNPAYPPHSGKMVLTGAPKSGWLEATFLRPVRYVGGFVTSSRRTVMAAFDANNKPVDCANSVSGNLKNLTSKASPNVKLSVMGANIHRVTLYTFDGQLTLDDFSFSF